VKISIKNFQNKIPIRPRMVTKVILNTLSQEGVKKSGELTICFVNDTKIKELNWRYLKRKEPTDVIAFDIGNPGDENRIFADIIVSSDRAVANAKIFHTNAFYELYLYLIHGLLHILGYNDKTPRQRQLMQKKENKILKRLLIKAKAKCLSTKAKQ
jgi:probable rRNA maturation factor